MNDGIIRRLKTELRQRAEDYATNIADGGCPDYEAYRTAITVRRTYLELIDFIDETVKKELNEGSEADEQAA